MLCSINDYALADGTISGGWALTGLRYRMQRYFDVITPLPFYPPQELGLLNPGKLYEILNYAPGDDFTNVGGQNVTGDLFVATGPSPAVWEHSLIVQISSPVLLDRNKRRADISFNVLRIHDTIKAAEEYISLHDTTIPRYGDIKLTTMGTEAVIALIVNGALISHELVRQIGKFTEHAYRITGSPIFAPTPSEDYLVTEDGDRITTEAGEPILVE